MKRNPSDLVGASIVLTASGTSLFRTSESCPLEIVLLTVSLLLNPSIVAGIRSGAGPQDYSASKAAVINLANTSAQALAGTGIRVVRLLLLPLISLFI